MVYIYRLSLKVFVYALVLLKVIFHTIINPDKIIFLKYHEMHIAAFLYKTELSIELLVAL